MKALKAWVARDDDGSLYMYTAKPKKTSNFWHAPKVGYVKLDDSLFPEVQWSDGEPKEIRLSIRDNMEKSKIKSALSFFVELDYSCSFYVVLCWEYSTLFNGLFRRPS